MAPIGTASISWPARFSSVGGMQKADPLIYVRVDGMVRLGEVASVKDGLTHVFGIVVANGVGEDRQQVIDTESRRFHQVSVVECRMHIAGVNQAPAIAEAIRVVAFHMKALLRLVLQNRDCIV